MSDPTRPGEAGETPKLHIDSDWKAQAQAEKERLAKLEVERTAERAKERESRRGPRGPLGEAGGPGAGEEEVPPADFKSLVGVLASQALMGLGAYADNQGRVVVDLVGSKFSIDLLGVLEEKSRGNLTPEESKEMQAVLGELRSRFVQIASMVAQQMKAQGGMPPLVGDPGSGIAGRIDPTGGGRKPILEVP